MTISCVNIFINFLKNKKKMFELFNNTRNFKTQIQQNVNFLLLRHPLVSLAYVPL